VGSTQSSFYWDELVEKRATSRGESQNDTSRTGMSLRSGLEGHRPDLF
jgi:hypothetical protein